MNCITFYVIVPSGVRYDLMTPERAPNSADLARKRRSG
jgi:hypothetical protein